MPPHLAKHLLLTATEVAELLGVTLPTLRKWQKTGRFLAPLPFGGAPRWERESLLAWLRHQQVGEQHDAE